MLVTVCAPAPLFTPGRTCAGAGLSLVIHKASQPHSEVVATDRAAAVALRNLRPAANAL